MFQSTSNSVKSVQWMGNSILSGFHYLSHQASELLLYTVSVTY